MLLKRLLSCQPINNQPFPIQMDIKLELFISIALTLFVLIGTIRVNLFKKSNDALLIGLISMLSIMFGIYLWIKNGMTLDYGTEVQIAETYAPIMLALGITNILVSLLFIFISIVKYLVWKISKDYINKQK